MRPARAWARLTAADPRQVARVRYAVLAGRRGRAWLAVGLGMALVGAALVLGSSTSAPPAPEVARASDLAPAVARPALSRYAGRRVGLGAPLGAP